MRGSLMGLEGVVVFCSAWMSGISIVLQLAYSVAAYHFVDVAGLPDDESSSLWPGAGWLKPYLHYYTFHHGGSRACSHDLNHASCDSCQS